MRPLVIVPAFNEEAVIEQTVSDVLRHGYDLIVVNDGSTDGTSDAARRGGARVLDIPINLGVGGALRCGFQWAVNHGHDVVVQCDADGQHRAEEIKALLEAQQLTGAHLVVGSRFASPEGWEASGQRLWAMRLLARLASRAAGTTLTDATSGFRCIAQPLLAQFAVNYPAQYLGDTFEAIVAAGRAGYRVAEVPTPMDPRTIGRSSATTVAGTIYLLRAILVTAGHVHFTVAPHLGASAAPRG